MFRSRFASLALAVVALVLAVASPVREAIASLARTCAGVARAAFDAVSAFTVRVLSGPVQLRAAAEFRAERELLVTETFALRQARRDRPRITSLWRMCPST